jgi:CDP-glucose 4,6-dehydratase
MVLVLEKLGANIVGYSHAPETTPSMFKALRLDRLCSYHQVADVRDFASLRDAVAKAEPNVALHMAAQPIVSIGYEQALQTFDTNVMGTANFLEACRSAKVPLTIVVSSDKCYRNDETGQPFKEDDALGGKDPYSASKAGTEIVVAAWAASFMNDANGMRLASGRAGNVIGGGDWSRDRLLPDAARAFSEGADMHVRNPASIRPWQHVLEPVCAYLLLAEKLAADPAKARGWNFGPIPSIGRPVREVMELATAAWGGGVGWNSPNEGSSSLKEAMTLLLDSSDAHDYLGWMPRLSIEESVDWTMQWYRDFYFSGPDAARARTALQIEAYLSLVD